MVKEKKESTLKRFLNSEPILFLKDLLIILLIVLIIRLFIAMPFQISWTSMKDSYYDREFIIVDRISYLFWTPKRWDVIVFRPHVNENKEYFLKRIIWIPWDELKIQDWEVFIKPKGKTEFIKINEPYLNEENKGKTWVWTNDWKVYNYSLKEGDYFVIWDNRNHSTDSRECFGNCFKRWPFVKKDDMIWKVFLDLWYFNFSRMRFITDSWEETSPRFFESESTHFYPELN